MDPFVTEYDFSIELGKPFVLKTLASTQSRAESIDGGYASGFRFHTSDFQLFDALGNQIEDIRGVGASGQEYGSYFETGDLPKSRF